MTAPWVTLPPSKRPLPREERSTRPYANVAPHIRGRVFKRGKTTFMQVVNTSTGRVLASDNTNCWDSIVHQAHEATAIARGAWTYALDRKELR